MAQAVCLDPQSFLPEPTSVPSLDNGPIPKRNKADESPGLDATLYALVLPQNPQGGSLDVDFLMVDDEVSGKWGSVYVEVGVAGLVSRA